MRRISHLRTAAGFLLTVLLCLPVVAPAQGRQAQDKPERRTIPVSVVDKDGNFVEGLTAENFRGKLKRKNIFVRTVVKDTTPRKVVIVVDSSLETTFTDFVATNRRGIAGNRWQIIWRTGVYVAFIMGASYPTALLTLGDHLQVESGFTREIPRLQRQLLGAEKRRREEVKERFESKNDSGRGSREGILDSLQGLAHNSSVAWQWGDALIVVGTMEDSRSKISLEEVQKTLVTQGIRLFCLWTNEQFTGFQSQYFQQGRNHGKKLSEATGGQWTQVKLVPMTEEKQDKLFKPLYAFIDPIYRVEIELPKGLKKQQKWKLEVVDERGKKIKGLKVLYPRLLIPLEAPSGN